MSVGLTFPQSSFYDFADLDEQHRHVALFPALGSIRQASMLFLDLAVPKKLICASKIASCQSYRPKTLHERFFSLPHVRNANMFHERVSRE